jgi:hypothetical protein
LDAAFCRAAAPGRTGRSQFIHAPFYQKSKNNLILFFSRVKTKPPPTIAQKSRQVILAMGLMIKSLKKQIMFVWFSFAIKITPSIPVRLRMLYLFNKRLNSSTLISISLKISRSKGREMIRPL